MKRPFLLLLLVVAGCVAQPIPQSTTVPDRIVLCKDLADSAIRWQLAYENRYHVVPVVISVHGGGDKHWTLFPDHGPPLDADAFVAGVVASRPGRIVLVASCNRKGFILHVAHTRYPRNVLWSIPGPDRRFSGSEYRMETWVGHVEELVEGKP